MTFRTQEIAVEQPRKVAIYARCATDHPGPGSIEDQVRKCQEFAREFGWAVEGVETDRATSGRTLFGREGWQELMRLARTVPQRFEGIILYDIARLGRHLPEVLRELDELEVLGVSVYLVVH